MRKFILYFIICSFLFNNAQADDGIFSNLDYPELQVAPRASERLAQLADLEEKQGSLLQWTLWSSGLLTLYSASRNYGNYKSAAPTESEKRDGDYVSQGGLIIGLSWVTLGTYMGYRKWTQTKVNEIKKISGKDKRSDLSRERAAEEALEYAAMTTTTLENLAVLTNFSASLLLIGFAQEENRIFGMIAATASFLPWLFPNPYSIGYQKHIEYKRKIYSPLIGLNLTESKDPVLNMTWYF